MRNVVAQLRRSESGAAAVEFALVAMVALMTFLGIIEFGRILFHRNEMAYAADLAARLIMTNAAAMEDDAESAIRAPTTFGAAPELEVTVGSESLDGISFRTVLIRYPVTLLIPGLTKASFVLTVDRRIPLT